MINRKKKLAILFIICCVGFFVAGSNTLSVYASNNILPKASDNLQISLREKSELVATDDGYMRVYYDKEKIGVEYYDEQFNIKSKKFLDMELDIWGGFYAGKNAYYIVEGQNNTAENDSAEVIRVIQYDKNWNKTGMEKITGNSGIFGGEVRYPFNYGCVEMTECNDILYIVTGHEGYVDSLYGQGHQGFLMIAVDEASMAGEIIDCDLWHSFAQYIESNDSNLYVLEQSEGSRYTKLSKYNAGDMEKTSIPVFEYGGSHTSAWALKCYASVDGMALASDNVLCLGTSIDQSKYEEVDADMSHNIYLTVTPKTNFTKEATTIKWLTDFNGGGKSFLGTKITKINEDRFMVSWEVTDEKTTVNDNDTLSGSLLHYVFIDGNGNKVSDEYTAKAPISDCHPIVKGSKIVYYGSNSNMVNFYMIDTQNGKFSSKEYRVAGDNATWNLSNDVLTIAGTGDMVIDTETHYRYPVSSVANSYVYNSSDNSWEPIRDKVKKIVIETGLTSISDNTFSGFQNLTEVNIKPGLKSIGAKAFCYCENLKKITIPSSVVEIGDDFLWTGFYWIGNEAHVVYATIYAEDNSYAVQYAKEHDIDYITDENTDIGGTPTTGEREEEKTTEEITDKTTETVTQKKNISIAQNNEVAKGKENSLTADKPTKFNIKNKKTYKKSKKVTVKDLDGIKTVKLNGKKISVKKGKTNVSFKLSKFKKYLKKKGKWNSLIVTDVNGKKKSIKFKII